MVCCSNITTHTHAADPACLPCFYHGWVLRAAGPMCMRPVVGRLARGLQVREKEGGVGVGVSVRGLWEDVRQGVHDEVAARSLEL